MQSWRATKEDLEAAQDLLGTLIANKDDCADMVTNMIGVIKCIVIKPDEILPLCE